MGGTCREENVPKYIAYIELVSSAKYYVFEIVDVLTFETSAARVA